MGKAEQRIRKERAAVKNAKRLGRQPKEPCDNCGKPCYIKLLSEYDPFVEEIYGRKEECHLCPDCYHEACMDI